MWPHGLAATVDCGPVLRVLVCSLVASSLFMVASARAAVRRALRAATDPRPRWPPAPSSVPSSRACRPIRPASTTSSDRSGPARSIASYYYGFGDVFPGEVERTFSRTAPGRSSCPGTWVPPGSLSGAPATRRVPRPDRRGRPRLRRHVYVRPWPEMNGDWQTFQPTADGSRPHGGTYAEFRQAWRHVVTYLRTAGATNLRWVFNPTADTYAETTPVQAIWPGSRRRRRARDSTASTGGATTSGEGGCPSARSSNGSTADSPVAPDRAGLAVRGCLKGTSTAGRCPPGPQAPQVRLGPGHARGHVHAPHHRSRVVPREEGTGLAAHLVTRGAASHASDPALTQDAAEYADSGARHSQAPWSSP